MELPNKNYISRCPYEVLQQILSYTITDRPTTRRVDLSLRQVSQLFRDVADSLLWRTLNINNVVLKLLRQSHEARARVEYEVTEFDKCVRNLRFVGTEMQWSRDLIFTRDERGATRPFLSYEEARDIYKCAGDDIVQRFGDARRNHIYCFTTGLGTCTVRHLQLITVDELGNWLGSGCELSGSRASCDTGASFTKIEEPDLGAVTSLCRLFNRRFD
jgi:hypothetical protein